MTATTITDPRTAEALTDAQIEKMLKDFAIAVMFGSLEDRRTKSEPIRAALAATTQSAGEPSVPASMKIVTDAMRADPGYAWSWHCNIAMAFVDEGGEHAMANHAAARFMRLLASVEPAHELSEKPKPVAEQPNTDALRDELALIESVLKGYAQSMARADALRALAAIRAQLGEKS